MKSPLTNLTIESKAKSVHAAVIEAEIQHEYTANSPERHHATELMDQHAIFKGPSTIPESSEFKKPVKLSEREMIQKLRQEKQMIDR